MKCFNRINSALNAILVLFLWMGCADPYFANLHSETGNEEYPFSVEAIYLAEDENGYYHMELNSESNQSFARLVAYTNNPQVNKVMWTADVYWIYQGEEVPVVNSASYTDEETGEAYTMFAPIYSMRGDTITIWSWYYDEWNGNKYYNTSIRVVVY